MDVRAPGDRQHRNNGSFQFRHSVAFLDAGGSEGTAGITAAELSIVGKENDPNA